MTKEFGNNKLSDEELTARSQRGDQAATEELLTRYAGIVRGKARQFFLNGGDTEDLIQEGMIGLCFAIGDYRGGDGNLSFKNFAHLCVSRRIIDAVKKSARKKHAPLNNAVSLLGMDEEAADCNPEEEMILNDDRREFMQKVSRALSDFEFKIMMMYIDGMTREEICEATEKSEKSVDNAIHRSKKKLQDLYQTKGK
ncbi:MAG: sigma-70 family RNA polymerase sigma factor [Clostridia bacterium]|nr:sigma-70 family RNA polymerase sigma factor [Clostridia bacterium]